MSDSDEAKEPEIVEGTGISPIPNIARMENVTPPVMRKLDLPKEYEAINPDKYFIVMAANEIKEHYEGPEEASEIALNAAKTHKASMHIFKFVGGYEVKENIEKI